MQNFEWSDGIGSRGRNSFLLFVRGDEVIVFHGQDIPGVVVVRGTDYTKSGKWSHTTYRLQLADGRTERTLDIEPVLLRLRELPGVAFCTVANQMPFGSDGGPACSVVEVPGGSGSAVVRPRWVLTTSNHSASRLSEVTVASRPAT